jgi:DHA2 family methylenomycin A resistance protein-like MFS transporter
VILTVLFVVRERFAEQPMLPLSPFRNHVFARTTLIGLVVNVPFYGLIFVFSLYFQKINGLSPLATGLAFVPMMGAVLPVNLLAPRLAERFGGPATVAAGAVLSAVACLALLTIERGTSYWVLFVPLIGMAAASLSRCRR